MLIWTLIEKIDNQEDITIVPSLTVKKKSLQECYILTNEKMLLQVKEVIVKGRSREKKWSDFVFGNPALLIELLVDEVLDENINNRCNEMVFFLKDVDAYSIRHEEEE